MDLVMFSGVMALGQMTPGPDWILVTRNTLVGGMRAGVRTAGGIACGLAIHATIALAGLAYSLRTYGLVWDSLKWLAAVYLVWLSWRITKDRAMMSGKMAKETVPHGLEKPFSSGFICNVTNIKVVLLLAAICSAFLGDNPSPGWVFALWSVIVVQGWLLWMAWSAVLCSRAIRSLHMRFGRWMDRLFAVGLIMLALRTLWMDA